MASKGTVVALVVVLALGGAGAAFALSKKAYGAPGTVSFTMRVVNANTNVVISGASVTYGSTTMVTDATGTAQFVNVPKGPLALSASALGYQNYGPTQFSPSNGVLYDIPLAPTGGGVTYDNSLLFQSSTEGAAVASVTFKNQNTISIPVVAWCVVKSGATTVSLGSSGVPQTVAPGQTVLFQVPLSPTISPGTYEFDFFAVDNVNRPVSQTTPVTFTVG